MGMTLRSMEATSSSQLVTKQPPTFQKGPSHQVQPETPVQHARLVTPWQPALVHDCLCHWTVEREAATQLRHRSNLHSHLYQVVHSNICHACTFGGPSPSLQRKPRPSDLPCSSQAAASVGTQPLCAEPF